MKIELENLQKIYDEEVVIDSISLSDDIRTLALIGKSGCGKSTLLRILGGIIEPSMGSAFIDGERARDSEEYRKNIGFVFQQNGLFQHLSALENITLPLIKVHNFTKEEAEDRAHFLLSRFGLEGEIKKRPRELSGGQQQRTAIARAVAPKPKILLLDEPTSALDPEYTTEVLNLISELKEEGLSFIIATHEMGFAYQACHKVAFMDQGRLVEYGHSKDIFKNPESETLKTFLSKLLKWSV